MKFKADKNGNYIIITEEVNIYNERSHNLYLLGIDSNNIYLEYSNDEYKIKENVEMLGSYRNGVFLENILEQGYPLIGRFSNGMGFHYSKIISISKERTLYQ